jgi:putative toxin-antitoxin system antitoxin component (TIGR02293 family)
MDIKAMHRSAGGMPRSAAALLVHAKSDDLSDLQILHLVQAGFPLQDVQVMISSSSLFRDRNLLKHITGKSARAIQRLGATGSAIRLTALQSSMAFQYAKAHEMAAIVFGSQTGAEAWLGRPCRQLSGGVPFDMLDTALGFNVVVDYLERARLGVYQ